MHQSGGVALNFTQDVSEAHVAAAIRYEARLRPHYFAQPASSQLWFDQRDGVVPILVCAPHATAAIREGRMRGPDTGTGWLAYMLHRLTGVATLHTVCASPSDPNFYDDNAFKRALAQIIHEASPRLVLDLHGCHWSRPFDVDLGTMHGASLLGQSHHLTQLRGALGDAGLGRLSDNWFAAARNSTITKWVTGLGVPCIQLEVQSTWLHPNRDRNRAHRSARLLQGLCRFIASTLAASRPN
ncbi:MAG: ketol-acid reductoisomerase [Chromatiales bacterium]|jgi:hypothetical protein|nr:ketol-acid reductoisomerase [Chromatiales bacterium]